MKTTTTEAQHTPTPWHTGDSDFRSILGPKTRRRNDDGRLRLINIATVATSDDDLEDAANAAFIVRACNSHAALVAALERLFVLHRESVFVCGDDDEKRVAYALDQARAALAAAKEGGAL